MKYIYLSPHFDDAAYSCGGLIWEQVQKGVEVEVWTICAGNPPPGEFSDYAEEHHERWNLPAEKAIAGRRKEDAAAMEILGARSFFFDIPDAIYRKHPKTGLPMYTNRDDLFGGLDPGDGVLVRRLGGLFARRLIKKDVIVCPLTVGNHVDHQLVRAAAELLPTNLWYYVEFPYIRDDYQTYKRLAPDQSSLVIEAVSERGLSAWQESVATYVSQISTFWESEDEMRAELKDHWEQNRGIMLWRSRLGSFRQGD